MLKMLIYTNLLVIYWAGCTSQFVTQSQTLPPPEGIYIGNDPIVLLNTAAGEVLIIRSCSLSYWQLMIWMMTAEAPENTGAVSILVVLHALKVPRPQVNQSVTTLEQMKTTMADWGVKPVVYTSNQTDLQLMRQQFIDVLRQGKQYIIAHFDKTAFGQPPGGEFAPIGAYDKATDRFLIMEVERYRSPPFWVRAEDLWAAMAQKGYVIVGY